MHLQSLCPELTHVSYPEDVVLRAFRAAAGRTRVLVGACDNLLTFDIDLPGTVAARRRMTAADIDDVFEGTVDIPVKRIDWREPVETILLGDEGDS